MIQYHAYPSGTIISINRFEKYIFRENIKICNVSIVCFVIPKLFREHPWLNVRVSGSEKLEKKSMLSTPNDVPMHSWCRSVRPTLVYRRARTYFRVRSDVSPGMEICRLDGYQFRVFVTSIEWDAMRNGEILVNKTNSRCSCKP